MDTHWLIWIKRVTRPSLITWILGAMLLLPCCFVIIKALDTSSDQLRLWLHLFDTTLPMYARTTAALLVGVVPLATAIGTTAAWVCARYEFPFRKILQVTLLLPLALPTYLLAYVVADTFQFALPGIRSLSTAVVLLAFTLFPYVYIPAFTAFREAGIAHFNAARTLGRGPWAAFFLAALPGSLSAVLTGSVFVALETAGDFGTSEHFALNTLAVGVYRTWFGHGSLAGAAQVSILLLGLTGLFLWAQSTLMAQQRFPRGAGQMRKGSLVNRQPLRVQQLTIHPERRTSVRGVKAFFCAAVCAAPVLSGFVLPVVLLIRSWWQSPPTPQAADQLFALSLRSLGISASAALCCLCAAMILLASSNAYRNAGWHTKALLRVLKGGYALPGTVLAVGVLLAAEWVTGALPDAFTPALIGTIPLLLFAHTCRYASLPLDQMMGAIDRLPAHLTEAAQTLGSSRLQALRRVILPLLRPTALSASALVFVDVLKELPTNMLLAPFDFETLPVFTYNLASDERLGAAAPAALLIVGVGLIPIVLLVKASGLLRS